MYSLLRPSILPLVGLTKKMTFSCNTEQDPISHCNTKCSKKENICL